MPPAPTKGFYCTLRVATHGAELHVLQRWRVTRAELPLNEDGTQVYGISDFAKRTIYIHRDLPDSDYWATLYHETTHVSVYDLAEEAVVRCEENWEHVFTKAGFFTEDD